MIPRGATVIETRPSIIMWCQTDMWTPRMRTRALQRMDASRKRPIWHKDPHFTKRVVHVPCR